MKKIILLLLIFILAAIAPSSIYGQTLKAGLNAGMNYFMLNSFFGEGISQNGFGFAHEASYGINAKYEFKNYPASLTARFAITPLGSEGTRFFIRTGDPAANTIDPRQKINISSSLYMLGIGAEYNFYEDKVFTAYIGADVIGAYFGKFDIESSDFIGRRTDNIPGFFRLGAGAGPGAEIKLFSKLSLDVSAKFSYYNLIGKKKVIYAYDYEGGLMNVEEDYIPGVVLAANLLWSL